IEDMPQAYSDADTIVARCGSGTLFEILWAAKPAYLIPYPFAAANHQRANADAIKPHLNCEIFDERPFNAEHALVRFTAFLKNLPRTPRNPPEARAEEKIIRYIKESL
ncbi:MAG TPA: glycosyltransferase, partial [Turneriella sp.]|nr:glycosyltransferase [Turneriella sp.]